MSSHRRTTRGVLLGATALVGALGLMATPAGAQQRQYDFDLPAQPLDLALREFARTANQQLIFADGDLRGLKAPAVSGSYSPDEALQMLLAGTGLQVRRTASGVVQIAADIAPQSGSAAGDGAEVEALIVTAQKREEDIQDVPIAISAFTQEQLDRSQVAGGPDLMTQVPNMTFTKTNFSSYSIQIRGIGTQAISATTDAAVAVAFNNTPFIRNRFFEQEFYDLQRVEVLRGPQGTLYGRNATAGVVNLISQKPKFGYEAKLSADVANYSSTRLEGMLNLPLADDVVALRLAGAWTKREGYATNQLTGNQIDGRDLWSTRLSLRFTPTDRIEANLIWEHFQEDDDRLRSGKQLCKTHEPTEIAGINNVVGVPLTENPLLANYGQGSGTGGAHGGFAGAQAIFSQGCAPASLYSPESFQTPNGYSLPYYVPLSAIFLPTALDDPYVSRSQSSDLRVIESTVEPEYRAKSDLAEVQVSVDLTDALTLTSETAYSADTVFSLQDYNRFTTASGAWKHPEPPGTFGQRDGVLLEGPNGGIFCDPQLGCSDRLMAVDVSTAKARQFSQELRVSSNFDAPFNFSLGANFLRADSEDKYYVFINSLSLISAISPYGSNVMETPYIPGVTDNLNCLRTGIVPPDYTKGQPIVNCTYMDPNPIGSLNDQGHNYFLSKNPYKLISYAIFGEAYYNITENVKVTAGLRWTVDRKQAPLIPSWLLASNTVGYPVHEVVNQEWREPTGRLTLDWKPDLPFTDETLVYASYAHGYKAGGANPPPYGVAIYTGGADIIIADSATKPKTFDPEFVNAFELGSKNTLLDGRLTLNTAAFYYDYTGYQISQIVDRSAANMNFDAEVWGLEVETDWRALENLGFGLKLGYENTRVADGEKAIDIMDRTAGQRGWVVYRPFPSIPSNCILPEWLFLGNTADPGNLELANLGGAAGGNAAGCELAYVFGVDPGNPVSLGYPPSSGKGSSVIDYTDFSTDLADYPGWMGGDTITDRTYPGADIDVIRALSNNGQGFFKDLSGKELPNAPHFTATITADYTLPLPSDWLMTLHTDLYYQSEAWTRIFNTEGYDKLKAYTNVNLAAIFTNEDAGWKVMAYVKNVFDRDSITGSFLNSDDTGLTTNVFLTEPRLYGLRVTKDFSGGPWWTGANPDHTGPYPLTVEVGGQAQRHDAPYAPVSPGFGAAFPSALQPEGIQNRDLDWGDGREVKLTYQPSGSAWQVSAGLRYGKANNDKAWFHGEVDGDSGCAFPVFLSYLCPIYVEMYGRDATYITATDFADASARDREAHTIVDFTVGRDMGLGMGLSRSVVSAGLRYAQFKSTSELWMRGIPDWDIADGWFFQRFDPAKYPAVSHELEARLDVQRKFEGVGPVVNWDASRRLFGADRSGHLDVDWSVGGGVLFGRQKNAITGTESNGLFTGSYNYDRPKALDPLIVTDVATHSSRSVSVPVLDLSLGLSYQVQRVKIGAGYRWERAFDAIGSTSSDAAYDRTTDGPYFKLAVGFGG